MNPLNLLDNLEADYKFAFRYYKEQGRRDEAARMWHELQGLRRARAIVVRCADSLEKAA